jgi:UDP-N-acetylmuramoyl-tripeptide--D-alanyl-D-alanine ligase
LHVAGRHNVRNALAATACAWAAGVSLSHIADGLTQFVPVNGRSRAMALHLNGHHVNLVDDSYNANPDSVRAAIDVLAELPGPRLLALGDMGEVGDQGLAFHQEVLTHAVECGIEHIWVAGDWMRQCLDSPAAEGWGPAVRGFDSVEALVSAAVVQAQGLASVLVKGSRFMRMERVVQALVEQQKQGGHHVA